MHQQLANYLSPAAPPTSITVPSGALGARQPVRPGGQIPKGHRPVPTTTETIKKTNAQIPYVRQVTQEQGVGGRWDAPQEGDIVMVEQVNLHRKMEHPAARLGHGTNSYAFARTLEQVNATLKEEQERRPDKDVPYVYETFPWRLDGVINNTDSEDPENEYRDYAIANVAVYGPVRLDHRPDTRCCDAKTLPGTTLYVGLRSRWARAPDPKKPSNYVDLNYYEHELFRFSALQLSRGTREVLEPLEGANLNKWTLVCAWRLGMVMDSAQSEGMITATVGVEPIRLIGTDDPATIVSAGNPDKRVEPYQWVSHPGWASATPPISSAGPRPAHVLAWRDGAPAWTENVKPDDDPAVVFMDAESPAEQLFKRWGHADNMGYLGHGSLDTVSKTAAPGGGLEKRNYPV
jgi:hypothetical protein